MLTIKVHDGEVLNEKTSEILPGPVVATLCLEHSLVSLSKWESKYEKPFLESLGDMTGEETFDYILMMSIDPDVPPELFHKLTEGQYSQIAEYLGSKQSATWFREEKKRTKKEIITSELIYSWMAAFAIPFTCETWNLNRLLTLIRVCGARNEKPKKMSRREQAAQQAALNAERKAKFNTSG